MMKWNGKDVVKENQLVEVDGAYLKVHQVFPSFAWLVETDEDGMELSRDVVKRTKEEIEAMEVKVVTNDVDGEDW